MAKGNAAYVSLDYLKYLLSEPDPNTITKFILENKSSFQRILKMDLRSGGLIIVLKILLHVSNSEFETSVSEIIQMTFIHTFIGSIMNFISNFKNSQLRNKGNEDLILIVSYLDVVVNELPLISEDYVLYISLLEQVLKTINNARFGNLPIRFWTEDLILLLKNKNLHLNRQDSSYSDLNDYPSPVDFFEERSLQSNIINHVYKNAEEYLDVQYKLLKEDYIKSVRDGIKQYKREIRGLHKTINPAISVYEDVTVHAIESNTNPRDGILHVILFSIEDEKRLKEEKYDKKIFMNGQLLYLSSFSQFTTFIIATVVDGNSIVIDEEGRKRKALKISVIGNPFKLKVKSQFVLVEPKTFFEPYYQVLKTLKFIKPSELPMSKYILNLDLKPGFPKYLSPKNVNIFLNHFDSFVLPMFNLNESQSRALKTALTNEFTIIQGPPGTGKTHLVKSIIKVLIKFKDCRSSPLFIVCSRNNSLDHVLAPMAKIGHKVIRLGSQTKSNILKDCTIPKLKTKSQAKWSTFNAIKTLKDELLSKEIDGSTDSSQQLSELDKNISSFIKLTEHENAVAVAESSIDIIGATTTGAARLRYFMSLLKPEVVIIEEAAEVFESHVVSSIPQGCKHVILIGDHQQLQPNPAHYSSVKHNMHISLFERLIANGINFCTLTEQHRMRPEIAALISPLIYKTLTNHKSVNDYPPVKGVSKSMFFIDHFVSEEETTETGSHWNKHEAQVLLALANYLIKQGYDAEEITLLSGYKAQEVYLNETVAAYSTLKEMKITSIDNYQGEENIIILLSLVRSQTGNIGFLKTSNRVNVALSRAKHGLFVIGNMSDLASHSKLWQELKNKFELYNAIDKHLPLKCQTHGNITKVKTKNDFNKVKLGGCTSLCGIKLKCGHTCKIICHPSLEVHNKVCEQPCHKVICSPHNLTCNLLCNKECVKCTKIIKKILKCGHEKQVYCCNQNISTYCETLISRKLKCGHSVTVPCSQPLTEISCPYPCNRFCFNGHKCVKRCKEKCGPCMVPMKKKILCFTFTVHCYEY